MGTKPFTSDPVTAMKFCVLPRTFAERDGCSYTEAKLIVRHVRPGVFEKPAPTRYRFSAIPSEPDAPTIAASRTESATEVSLQLLVSLTSAECPVTRCYQGLDAPWTLFDLLDPVRVRSCECSRVQGRTSCVAPLLPRCYFFCPLWDRLHHSAWCNLLNPTRVHRLSSNNRPLAGRHRCSRLDLPRRRQTSASSPWMRLAAFLHCSGSPQEEHS